MKNRFEERVWLEIDGDSSPDEARELDALRVERAGGDTPGDDLETEIRELAAELSEIRDVEAPASLKPAILAAIASRRSRPNDSGSLNVAGFPLPAAQRASARWRQWGYLAAGLLIASIVLYQLASGIAGSERSQELSGTVGSFPVADTPRDTPGADRQIAKLPDFVRLEQRDGLLAASLDTAGAGSGDSVFVFSAPGLEVVHIQFEEGAIGSYESSTDSVTVRASGSGRIEVRMALADALQPFHFSASGAELPRFEGEFFLYQLQSG